MHRKGCGSSHEIIPDRSARRRETSEQIQLAIFLKRFNRPTIDKPRQLLGPLD